MNCQPIITSFAADCRHISESLAYIESPITTAFDDDHIGAYVQQIGPLRYRISDNGETMHSAMVNQIAPSPSKLRKLSESIGHAQLAPSGEFFMVCTEGELGYSYAMFVEHISRLGQELNKLRPKSQTAFQRMISKVLTEHFGQSIKQNRAVIGASGHEVTFQFSLTLESGVKYINAIGAKPAGPNWSSIYSNVGKMMDVRGAQPGLNRVTVLERSNSPLDDEKAIVALAEVSKVIVFESQSQVCNALAA